jgi:hypothetical protein
LLLVGLSIALLTFGLLRFVGHADAVTPVQHQSMVKVLLCMAAATALLPYLPVLKRFVRYSHDDDPFRKERSRLLRFGIFLLPFLLFHASYWHIGKGVFLSANTEHTLAWSLQYAQFDAWLGVYGAVDWLVTILGNIPVLEQGVFLAYSLTYPLTLGTFFVLSFGVSVRLAREYGLALLLTVLLCAPGWLLFPAIAPHQLTITDRFDDVPAVASLNEHSEPIRSLYTAHQESQWAANVMTWSVFWETSTLREGGLAISCNPSMHVVWVTLMTIYLWRVRRVLGCVAGAYLGVVLVATLLYLQHYLIDLIAGLLVAVLVQCIARRVMVYERSRTNVDVRFWFSPLFVIQDRRDGTTSGARGGT